MKRDTVEIVDAEDGEEPAELCYEVDGVWLPDSEYEKHLDRRYRWLEIKESMFGIPIIIGIVMLIVWLVKG